MSQTQQLSIGAIAQLTQIPAHTLRKWESRHGIATPIRSETGRRIYTAEHVEILRLVKLLVARRHSLAQLSGLSVTELQALAGLHEGPISTQPADRVGLIGPNISRLLTGSPRVVVRNSSSLPDWQTRTSPELDCLVIESHTLPSADVDAILQLLHDDTQAVVIYTFASRQVLQTLSDAGARCIPAPVTDEDLFGVLDLQPSTPSTPAPPARFSADELARIAALTPGVACECPNHIAKLLTDIGAFERYSQQCEDSDPKERELHAKLGLISGQARQLFEEALLAVTTADGLTVELNEPNRGQTA